MKHGKKYNESVKAYDTATQFDSAEALATVVNIAKAKFDETVEVHIRLGVDSRHADQQVRGAVVLPNGTVKTSRSSQSARATRLTKLWLPALTTLVKNMSRRFSLKAGWISTLSSLPLT